MDANLHIAFYLGHGLHAGPVALPTALADVQARVQFIAMIDEPLLLDAEGVAQWNKMGRRLRRMENASRQVMPEVPGSLGRVSIALRLWSGCITAANAIARETLSGPNTPDGREAEFQTIDAFAATDQIFTAGVEAAPAFKTSQGQAYSLEGVPADSSVRRHG